jgi:DNA-binding transcriptional LysR family regulator
MDTSIDLRQFRYFIAVARTLSFRRAAEELHISQPPLSRQIRQLEEQLGMALFTRSKSGVALTRAGAAFLPQAENVLAQADKAIAAARAAHGSARPGLVLGYTTVFDRSIFPAFADRLRAIAPGARIVEKGKHSIQLVRDIRKGAMDAAFIGLHTEAEGLACLTIHEEPFVVALPRRHPLAGKRRLGFDDLRDARLFWFERRMNPGVHDYCKAYFDRIGFHPELVPEPEDHHILLGLIAEGRGVGLISQSLQRLERQGVVYRPLRDAPGLRMGIALAYDANNRSPLLRQFVELVRQSAPPG